MTKEIEKEGETGLSPKLRFLIEVNRAKYRSCISQKGTADKGRDVSTPQMPLPVMDGHLGKIMPETVFPSF